MAQDFEIINAKEAEVVRNYDADLDATKEQKILQGTLQSNFKTGSSASGVYGKVDYKATGRAEGMAQGVTAAIIPP